ncbi:hypothetical protein [Pseudactinotalea sp. Z1748]|uniref:hypothetical protein n=1 Tax=Pseudactinotalea sp. Z1748 TaxID=3413027 RepID=UPI003C7D90EC
MSTNSNQPRVPRGQATGGQFAETRRTHSGILLDEDEPTWDQDQVEQYLDQAMDPYLGAVRRFSSLITPNGDMEQVSPGASWDEHAVNQMREEFADFLTYNGHLMDQARQVDPGYGPEQVAEDFWLTRNRHGAGFWDRGLGQAGDDLAEAAHAHGSVDLMLDSQGRIVVA